VIKKFVEKKQIYKTLSKTNNSPTSSSPSELELLLKSPSLSPSLEDEVQSIHFVTIPFLLDLLTSFFFFLLLSFAFFLLTPLSFFSFLDYDLVGFFFSFPFTLMLFFDLLFLVLGDIIALFFLESFFRLKNLLFFFLSRLDAMEALANCRNLHIVV